MKREIIVIGTSAGGLEALKKILIQFRSFEKVAIVIIQHLDPTIKSYFVDILNGLIECPVCEIEDKTVLKRGTVYVVPPNYHALIEKSGVFTLVTTEKVRFARPSIDVTFESFADAFGESVVGVILTGANHDGGVGLKQIKASGGYTLVQDPLTAELGEMPSYAIELVNPDEIVSIDEIGDRLNQIIMGNGENLC